MEYNKIKQNFKLKLNTFRPKFNFNHHVNYGNAIKNLLLTIMIILIKAAMIVLTIILIQKITILKKEIKK